MLPTNSTTPRLVNPNVTSWIHSYHFGSKIKHAYETCQANKSRLLKTCQQDLNTTGVTEKQTCQTCKQSRFYTHIAAVTQKHLFYTKTFCTHNILHRDALTHKPFYTQTLLHTEAFTHRHFYIDTFTHKPFYTDSLLHTEAFTHKHFYTQTLLHTNAFTHRSFYTQKPLHTDTFT